MMDETWQRALNWLDLADWRKHMAALFRARDAAVIAGEDAQSVWERWRVGRDALFAQHPQSPLSDITRQTFTQLPYYPYDPAWHVEGALEPLDDDTQSFDGVAPTGMQFRRAARLHFTLAGEATSLMVYWIDVYGGSLFLPFSDESNKEASYIGGRYLIDTAKGSDFIYPDAGGRRVIVDLNYAYNPSCAYDDRWFCPLAPRENKLKLAIHAGEQSFHP